MIPFLGFQQGVKGVFRNTDVDSFKYSRIRGESISELVLKASARH
jgi:hypothetical protein